MRTLLRILAAAGLLYAARDLIAADLFLGLVWAVFVLALTTSSLWDRKAA